MVQLRRALIAAWVWPVSAAIRVWWRLWPGDPWETDDD